MDAVRRTILRRGRKKHLKPARGEMRILQGCLELADGCKDLQVLVILHGHISALSAMAALICIKSAIHS